jgi:hypothetical protein
MVSAATALRWSQTINQRAAAIDSNDGNGDCGDDRDAIVAAAATAALAVPTVAKAVPTAAEVAADVAMK